jgi:type VI secretion system ImpM family protein
MGLGGTRGKRFTLGCYGKLPCRGDYVRLRAESSVTHVYDRWLEDGLAAVENADGSLPKRLDRASPARIAMPLPDGDSLLVGVMAPSHDKVGRRFPVLVFTTVRFSDYAGDLSLPPIGFDGFFDVALGIAARLLSAKSLEHAEQIVSAGEFRLDLGREEERVFRTFAARPAPDFLTASFPARPPNARAAGLVEAVQRLRATAGDAPNLLIPAVTGSVDLAFWLALVRRLGKPAGRFTLLLWRIAHLDRAPAVWIDRDRPGPQALAFAFGLSDSDTALLPTAGDRTGMTGVTERWLLEATNPRTTLADLLHSVIMRMDVENPRR